MSEYWAPFLVMKAKAPGNENAPRALPPRSILTPEGVGDRMRSAAFAELQAQKAFAWAAEHFTDAPAELRDAWRRLSRDEERHLNWILGRMSELGIDPAARTVSDQLWLSLQACRSAREFAHFIANAEERGRRAGIRFQEELKKRDLKTAEIFRKIVEEELDHVALTKKFYPDPGPRLGSEA